MNLRSLRVRLCLWYVLLSMISMTALGGFSYVYLAHALASSRQATMERRKVRLLRFLEVERTMDPRGSLNEELSHFMQANPDTDRLEVDDVHGAMLYAGQQAKDPIAWIGGDCMQPCFRILTSGHHSYRSLQQTLPIHGRPYRVTMAGMIDEHYDILRMVQTSFLIFLPMMFLGSIGGGFMLSQRALEPVDLIMRSAHLISLRRLDHRLPVPRTGDELQRLAETWNDLLERLEIAVTNLKQFTGDISHDLRTSITVMLSTSQLALRRERSQESYRESLETIRSECESTAALLDDLLVASNAEGATKTIDRKPVDLGALVLESCGHVRARAEMKQQSLMMEVEGVTWINGDLSLLRRMISILLDNALKYTGEGGTIVARVWSTDRRVSLEVKDTGVGIAHHEVSKIFNRSYRADASRSRDEGGSGLGLAIAKWIAEAHSTEIRVVSAVKGGSAFSVEFSRVEIRSFSADSGLA